MSDTKKTSGKFPCRTVAVARKPGSVRGASHLAPRGGHSSGTRVTARLVRPTLGLGRAALERPSTWPCSGWGLPCRDRCRSRGGLLPHRFTLTGGTLPSLRRFRVFCGTFLEVTLTGRYPASCPAEPGLSSRAANRPSDRLIGCGADGLARTARGRQRSGDHAALSQSLRAAESSAIRLFSLRFARASSCRARSRETPSRRPISARESSSSASAISRFSTM